MEPKDYQRDALDKLGDYAALYRDLSAKYGRNDPDLDPCELAWKKASPASSAPWVRYEDGHGRSIPHVCLKVPTGGGKTYMAVHGLDRVNRTVFNRQTGLVLWIVPKSAIYDQTVKAMRNNDHPYTKALKRASGGRLLIREKEQGFTPTELETHLVIMVVMLQSLSRKAESADFLRMTRRASRWTSFFPELDDVNAHAALHAAVPNLRSLDLADWAESNAGAVPSADIVCPSLESVLRVHEPVIILDEGHIASTETARTRITGFNPRFILELTATPKPGKSNALVDVNGRALCREQMIKLPIRVQAHVKTGWQEVLDIALAQRLSLEADALELHKRTGRQIRPIMIVRCDYTGPKQINKTDGIHVETVRRYLQDQKVRPDWIAVRSASADEIAGEALGTFDSEIRIILTKDALKEGWDCPPAYQLVMLTGLSSVTALQQLVGRILRQPGAAFTGVDTLDACYVHAMDADDAALVDAIGKGLMNEGLGDLANQVITPTKSKLVMETEIERREAMRGRSLAVPIVRAQRGDDLVPLDHTQDILAKIDFTSLAYRHAADLALAQNTGPGALSFAVGLREDLLKHATAAAVKKANYTPHELARDLDIPSLVRSLTDVVPNPWQAHRILMLTLDTLRQRYTDEHIATHQHILTAHMREDLRQQIDAKGREIFVEGLKNGTILFSLLGDASDYHLPHKHTVIHTDEDLPLFSAVRPAAKTLMAHELQRDYNGLERMTAVFLDEHEAVRWWYRVGVRGENYAVQGWRRNKIYPDFLVSVDPNEDGETFDLVAIETKGSHLDNPDTAYKLDVFERLRAAFKTSYKAGTLELEGGPEDMRMGIVVSSAEPEVTKSRIGALI